jgi:ABC-type branched-subunit amino acid transport system substrate-binding protein
LKENFNKITNSYSGASGKIKLDDNGDRSGEYDFWMVQKNQGTNEYKWKNIHYYHDEL